MAADNWGRLIPQYLFGDASKVTTNSITAKYTSVLYIFVNYCWCHPNAFNITLVAQWFSGGFQAKEAKAQLTLWSEPVLKAVQLMFSQAEHSMKAHKTHMHLKTHRE